MIWKAPRAPRKKPDGVQVKARRVDFHFDSAVPRYWFDGDPFQTHFLNALSLTFPEGERMFMDAVRAVRDQVQNPTTRADIAGFLGQEALHSRAHEGLNGYLAKLGYPSEELERRVREEIASHRPNHTRSSLLALTCALEHITAIMGNLLLAHPEMQEQIHASVRPLWVWHALEEMEHKAVAFDVYEELYGNYQQRVMWLIFCTIGLLTTATRFQREFLARDGLAGDPAVWLKGIWKLWGPGGWLIRLVPAWLAYFRRDFHPWQHDNSALITRYRAQFEARPEKPSGVYSAASGQASNDSSAQDGEASRSSSSAAQARM